MAIKDRVISIFNHISEAAQEGDTDKVRALSELGNRILQGEDHYLNISSSDPAPGVAELTQEASKLNWEKLYAEGKTQYELEGGMCAGEHESVVLQIFASALKAKRVLEIGMFVGSTTLALASVKSVETVVSLDIEPYLETIAKPYWEKANVAHKIRPIFGSAIESLKTLKDEKQQFDVVFIDADKSGYTSYFDALLDFDLLAKDGVIFVDNTAASSYVWEEPSGLFPNDIKQTSQVMKDFNGYIKNDPRVDTAMLPIRDGVTIVKKKD